MITLALALSLLAEPERQEQKIPGSLVSFWTVKTPAGNGIKSLWVGETELTWDVYDIFAFRLDLTGEEQAQGVDIKVRPSKPYGAPDRGFGHHEYPALGMTLNSAQRFCDWLNKKTGLKYRLPTEAEWEYIARAGATENPADYKDIAWYWDNADDSTHPVKKMKPNAWGIYDTLGNAWEWATDSSEIGVVCGGAYNTKPAKMGFGARLKYDPKWQEADAHVPKSKWWLSDGPFIGMRIVRDAD